MGGDGSALKVPSGYILGCGLHIMEEDVWLPSPPDAVHDWLLSGHGPLHLRGVIHVHPGPE